MDDKRVCIRGVRGGVRGCERWCYCQSTFLHCLVGEEGGV